MISIIKKNAYIILTLIGLVVIIYLFWDINTNYKTLQLEYGSLKDHNNRLEQIIEDSKRVIANSLDLDGKYIPNIEVSIRASTYCGTNF